MGLRNRFITVTPEAEVLKAKQLMIGTIFCFFSFFDALFSVFASYTRIFAIMYFMMDLRSNNLSHAKKKKRLYKNNNFERTNFGIPSKTTGF